MVEVETQTTGGERVECMSKGGTTSTTMESGRGARSGNAILITFFTSPRLSPDAVSLEREEIAAQCNPSAA